MSLTKRAPLAALLTLAALAGCSGGAAPAPGAAASDAPPTITTAVAEGRTVPDTLALSGTLLADEDSRLAPVLPGRVVEVLVDRGDEVTQGQPLVRLRDADQRLQSQAARAALAQARSQADEARARLLPSFTATGAYTRNEIEVVFRSTAPDGTMLQRTITPYDQLDARFVLTVPIVDASSSAWLRACASAARAAWRSAWCVCEAVISASSVTLVPSTARPAACRDEPAACPDVESSCADTVRVGAASARDTRPRNARKCA